MIAASNPRPLLAAPAGMARRGGRFGAREAASRELFSQAIRPRIIALAAGLSLIKLLMLVAFRKHLFETHWRVDAESAGWINGPAFGVFALLVGFHLWTLGTRCAATGLRAIRTANLCIIVLGLAFVLLTFHEGDKNYLAPIFSGVLTWRNLGDYLILNSFFRAPFLALWVGGYALVYFFLARSARERLVLRVTALGAAAYTALYLRDFMEHRDALLVADCFGVAGLVGARSRRPLALIWQCLPLLWLGFMFWLFRPLTENLSQPEPELVVLVGGSLVLFTGIAALAWRAGFGAAWSWLAPFAGAAFLLLVNVNYPSAPNYNHLLCLALTWPRYLLGAFALAGVLGAAAWLWQRWRPSASVWWLDGVNLGLITLGLVDLRLTQILGVRLDWQVLAFSSSPKMMWRMAGPYLPSVALLIVTIISIYGLAVFVLRRPTDNQPEKSGASNVWPAASLGLAFLLLALAGRFLANPDKAQGQTLTRLVTSSPLWKNNSGPLLNGEQFAQTVRSLGLGQMLVPAPVTSNARRDLNVVLIFQESSYNKYLSLFGGKEDTEPLLAKYRDRMEVFPNFFSSFASSIHARFAAFTGLYPVRDYNAFTLQRVGVKSLFDILHAEGYHSSLFYSSFFDYTGFGDFLRGRGLDESYDADSLPGKRTTAPISWGVREEETLGAMRAQIKTCAAQRKKFFLTYVPAAPHYPYDSIPDRFRKYPLMTIGDYSPKYLNELLYMDWVIASLVDELRDAGVLDQTLVVITDDHGEMLGENGGPIGHGWVVTPELANVPLIVLDPARPGYRVNPVVGSQVDLLPTVLDLLGIPTPADQLYQGRSLYGGREPGTLAYLNSFQQYAVIRDVAILCGDRPSDPARTGDPVAKVYSLATQGAHTTFLLTNNANANLPPIAPFDRFQANLLAHYSDYCTRLRPSGPVATR